MNDLSTTIFSRRDRFDARLSLIFLSRLKNLIFPFSSLFFSLSSIVTTRISSEHARNNCGTRGNTNHRVSSLIMSFPCALPLRIICGNPLDNTSDVMRKCFLLFSVEGKSSVILTYRRVRDDILLLRNYYYYDLRRLHRMPNNTSFR